MNTPFICMHLKSFAHAEIERARWLDPIKQKYRHEHATNKSATI